MNAWKKPTATIDHRPLGCDRVHLLQVKKEAGVKTPAFLVMFRLGFRRLEREQDIPHFHAPAGFLQIAERATAAIGNPHLGNAVIGNGIV